MSEGLQPASVSTEASSDSNSNDSAVGIGITGGGGGTHDLPNLDEELEQELEEHTFDEDPDYNRIREDSHLDGGEYTLDEGGDDDPDEGLAGRWTTNGNFGGVYINKLKIKQWELAQNELNDIKERAKVVWDTRSPTYKHVVEYFFGDKSLIWVVFRNRLRWTHQKFLLFMITNTRLSSCRCSTAELFNDMSAFDTTGVMAKEEFIACWDEICKVGELSSASMTANAEDLFWEQVEDALNTMLKNIVIIGRNGKQIYLIDDDKVHFESHQRNHRHWLVKLLKHVKDNRWGMVLDTLCCPALLMVCNIHTHRKGEKQIDATQQQLFGSAFGNNALRKPDLSETTFFTDRGYTTKKQHVEVVAPTGANHTGTMARAPSAAYHFGKRVEGDKRTFIEDFGASALYVSEKTVSGNRKLTQGASLAPATLFCTQQQNNVHLKWIT